MNFILLRHIAHKIKSSTTKSSRTIINTVFITALALLSAIWIRYDFTSLSFFAPFEKAQDFISSDFYALVADSETESLLQKDIVALDASNLNKTDLASALNCVASANPDVVVIDMLISDTGTSADSLLSSALSKLPNLVYAYSGDENPDIDNEYNVVDEEESAHPGEQQSIFLNIPHATPGACELNAFSIRDIIRAYSPTIRYSENDCKDGLALAAVKKFAPEKSKLLESRGNDSELIDFSTYRFYHDIPLAEVTSDPELIEHKLVFIGNFSDLSDMRATPLNNETPGVMIHAYAACNILEENYYNPVSEWIEWILGIICCAIVLLMELLFKDFTGVNMIIRWTQGLLLLTLIFIGTYIYLEHHICLDLTIPLLMVFWGLFASDLVTILSSLPSVLRKTKNRIAKFYNQLTI